MVLCVSLVDNAPFTVGVDDFERECGSDIENSQSGVDGFSSVNAVDFAKFTLGESR